MLLPSQAPHSDADGTRGARSVRVRALPRKVCAEPVGPATDGAGEAIVELPPPAGRRRVNRAECAPLASVVELQLDELAGRGQRACDDPSREGDPFPRDHSAPTRPDLRRGPDAHLDLPCLWPD